MAGMLPTSPESDLYYYYKLRNQLPPDSPLHAVYGPLEHGQAMEEMVGRDPLSALPLALVGIPGYTLGKAAGMLPAPAITPAVIARERENLRAIENDTRRADNPAYGFEGRTFGDILAESAALEHARRVPVGSPRSPASLDELLAAYQGLGRGLKTAATRGYGSVMGAIDRMAMSPEERAQARLDPAFRQADDEWQAFMRSPGMLPR